MAVVAFAALVVNALFPGVQSEILPAIDDSSVLMQGNVVRVSEETEIKPLNERLDAMRDKFATNVDKMVSGMSKNIHSALQRKVNELQETTGEQVTADTSPETTAAPVAAAPEGTSEHAMGKLNHALDEMKGGMRELAKTLTVSMNVATQKMAAEIAQSVHEHVQQELETAKLSPSSLLQLDAAATQHLEKPKKGDPDINAPPDPVPGAARYVDEIDPELTKMKKNPKYIRLVNRWSHAGENMKEDVKEFTQGLSVGVKEASERIAGQVATTVHEHVRQEIELARASDPAS